MFDIAKLKSTRLSPTSWELFTKLETIGLWAILTSLILGWITVSQPLLAHLLTFSLIFVWPGLMLLDVFQSRLESWLSKLALSFVLSFGLWSILAGLLMKLHASAIVEKMIWLVLTVTLSLSLLIIFRRITLKPKDIDYLHRGAQQPDRGYRVAWLFYCIGVGVCLTITLIVFAKNASPYWPSDRSTYQDYILYFLEDQNLYTKILTGRVEIQSWIVMQAMLVKISQTNLLDMYVFYLPPMLMVLSFFASFIFAWELFNDQIMGMLAVIVQTLFIFSDINGPSEFGSGFFRRLIEDKYLLVFVLLPLAGWLTLRYLRITDRTSLIALIILLTAMVFVHPLGLVFYGLSFVPFIFFHFLINARRQLLFKLIPIGATLFILTLFVGDLYKSQNSLISNNNIASFSFEQALANPWLANTILVLNNNSELYILSPDFILRPLNIVAIGLFPLLIFMDLRRNKAAQFLFATTMSVLLACFTPIGTIITAKFVTIFLIYRIIWILPVSLIITLFLGKIIWKFPDSLMLMRGLFNRFSSKYLASFL